MNESFDSNHILKIINVPIHSFISINKNKSNIRESIYHSIFQRFELYHVLTEYIKFRIFISKMPSVQHISTLHRTLTDIIHLHISCDNSLLYGCWKKNFQSFRTRQLAEKPPFSKCEISYGCHFHTPSAARNTGRIKIIYFLRNNKTRRIINTRAGG